MMGRVIPVLCEVLPRPDGSVILRPRLPLPDEAGDVWVRVGEAARVLCIDRRKVYPFLGDLLVYRRPLSSLHQVLLESAIRLRDATRDPEFWDEPRLQSAVREWVRERMCKGVATELQRV